MILSTFFMILAIILFIEGIIGIYFSDRMDNQSTFLFALIFLIMSIILFISCYGLSNNNTDFKLKYDFIELNYDQYQDFLKHFKNKIYNIKNV